MLPLRALMAKYYVTFPKIVFLTPMTLLLLRKPRAALSLTSTAHWLSDSITLRVARYLHTSLPYITPAAKRVRSYTFLITNGKGKFLETYSYAK